MLGWIGCRASLMLGWFGCLGSYRLQVCVCVWVEGDVLACLYGGMLRPLLRLRTLAVILGWRSFDGIKTVLMPVYTS